MDTPLKVSTDLIDEDSNNAYMIRDSKIPDNKICLELINPDVNFTARLKIHFKPINDNDANIIVSDVSGKPTVTKLLEIYPPKHTIFDVIAQYCR